MPLYEFVVLGLCLPAAVAAVLLLAIGWPARATDRARLGDAGATLALTAGYAAGHAAILGWPPIPPLETTQWLMLVAIGAGLLGIFADCWRGPVVLRGVLWLLGSVGIVWAFLHPLLAREDQSRVEVGLLASLAIGCAYYWGALECLAAQVQGPSLTLAMTASVAAAAPTFLFSHSVVHARLAGALLAALLGFLAVSAFLRGGRLSRGGAAVGGCLIAALALDGHFYADLPTASALLFPLAPLALWFGQDPEVKRMRPWPRALLLTIAVLAPLAIAVAIALVPWLHEDTGADTLWYRAPLEAVARR
jgi:hypothetical protein